MTKHIKLEKQGLIDIKNVKTLRGDTFARAMITPSEEGEGAKLLLASGFEVKVLKNNEKHEHNLLVDAYQNVVQVYSNSVYV